jgi:hypothetical protein
MSELHVSIFQRLGLRGGCGGCRPTSPSRCMWVVWAGPYRMTQGPQAIHKFEHMAAHSRLVDQPKCLLLTAFDLPATCPLPLPVFGRSPCLLPCLLLPASPSCCRCCCCRPPRLSPCLPPDAPRSGCWPPSACSPPACCCFFRHLRSAGVSLGAAISCDAGQCSGEEGGGDISGAVH